MTHPDTRDRSAARTIRQSLLGLLGLLVLAAIAWGGQWLPGDTHSHISPPDVPPAYDHAVSDLERAIAAARTAGLKWLIITPHAMHQNDPKTGKPLHQLTAEQLAARKPTDGDPLVILGWEHTRNWPGHMTVSFMDLARATKMKDAELFDFARTSGGLLIVAHPFQLPNLLDPANRSWKPWTAGPRGQEMDQHLTGLEIRHSGSPAQTAAAKWDEWIGRQQRRIIGVGATDDHVGVLFPTTWVYIDGKLTAESLHQALRNGRIIAGGNAAAGSLTVTSDIKQPDGKEQIGSIGDAIRANKRIIINWQGEGRLYISGQRGAATRGPISFTLPEPDSFHWVRLEVGNDSYANPIYINLPNPTTKEQTSPSTNAQTAPSANAQTAPSASPATPAPAHRPM